MVLHTDRRAEISTIQLSDCIAEYNPGIVRLTLHGKGRKDPVEFLKNRESEMLKDWLKFRGSDPGPLFNLVRKSDEIVKEPLTPWAVYMTIQRRMTIAGIQNATSHDKQQYRIFWT
jgi:integrase